MNNFLCKTLDFPVLQSFKITTKPIKKETSFHKCCRLYSKQTFYSEPQ